MWHIQQFEAYHTGIAADGISVEFAYPMFDATFPCEVTSDRCQNYMLTLRKLQSQ